MNGELFDDVDGTREEILAATYRALREHGYSGLTVQRIGEEFGQSTSLLYYHYENKDEIVLETLEFSLERFEEHFTTGEITDPRGQIETFLDRMCEALTERAHLEVLLELRARATHDERYRRHFERSDRAFETYLSDVIAAGIEEGTFREVDPDAVAATLIMLLNGMVLRRSTERTDEWIERAEGELTTYLETRLYLD